MGLLASLLPGLRELRAPLAAGFLWLGVLYVAFPSTLVEVAHLTSALPGAAGPLDLPTVVGSALLVGTAYLLGAVAQSLTDPVLTAAGAIVRAGAVWLDTKQNRDQKRKQRKTYPPVRPRWFFQWLRGLRPA